VNRGSRAAALVGTVVLSAAAACGLGTDEEPRAIDAENVPNSLAEETTTATAEETETSQVANVWLIRSTEDRVRLEPRPRNVPLATPRGVLEALLVQTPTEEEREEGLTTSLPGSTALNTGPSLGGDGVLVVDLTSGIFEVEGQTLRNAFGQLVCTVTELDAVTAVVFEVEGEQRRVPDGEGQQTGRPLRCESYERLLDDSPTEDDNAP
jgi:spore germination protein GerM